MKNYHVKLEGKSQLHEPIIKLEGIAINIWTIDGGITWENKDVKIEVNENLEVYMSCKALSGTNWNFYIKNKENDVKIFTTEGKTGEELDSRGGQRISNFSERIISLKN